MQQILQHLEVLVAADTRNPPRNIQADAPIFEYIRNCLAGFQFEMWDYQSGSVGLLATRGNTPTLYNFHLDTVPTSEHWSKNPFVLTVGDECAFGLGSCDIKGALACMLSATSRTQDDVAILITTDEEAGNSTCVRSFLANEPSFQQVIVAEPTRCQAVTAHRGITNASIRFAGVPGHGSDSRALSDNAIHRAMIWGEQALKRIQQWDQDSYQNLKGVRFNTGTISGGIKPNMIAPSAEVKISLRTLPGQSGAGLLEQLVSLSDSIESFEIDLELPPLPTQQQSNFTINQTWVEKTGIPLGPAVDFWTEAALFSEARMNTFVLGSGDIAQAHVADEWVELSQLAQLTEIYQGLISNGI